MTEPSDIPLPKLPEPPPPYTFPVLATLAPVVASLGMWAVTRSPFALMFAVLGPLVAIGSLVDARLQGRRRSRRELARFERGVVATMKRIDQEHERLRHALWRQSRSASLLLPAALHDSERWRRAAGEVQIVAGVGARASGVRLTGAVPDEPERDEPHGRPDDGGRPPGRRRRGRGSREAGASERVAAGVRALRERAAILDAAPVAVDARLGIGICGARVPALAAARAIVIQLADALPPGAFTMQGGFETWHRELPHFVDGGEGRSDRVDFIGVGRAGEPTQRIPVVVAETADALPRECRIGVEVSGGELRMLRHPLLGTLDRQGVAAVPSRLRADFVSAIDAARFAATLAAAAEAEGLRTRAGSVPDAVALDAVWEGASDGVLPAVFAVGSDGPVVVDLVADGPHAVVGGTTGSGKSELLIGWVLAMARVCSPEQVTFLLVDFKGGSSFGAVAALPHSVGLITDLDHASAARALESLRAELRHRERVLADAGARSIDDAPSGALSLPRLVVVVDEFAAMVSDFPELHALFADIAARGRSLGVHLILCTQRPGGVLRDSVMANCTLRLSLRVNNAQDSVAVIGTDAAATLHRNPVGRSLLSVAGGEPALVQVALADAGLASEVAIAWPASRPPRRPWLPPLPPIVDAADLEVTEPLGGAPSDQRGIPFGLLDVPDEQRQCSATWVPQAHGNLLVLGGQGAGRTTALATLGAAAAARGLRVVALGADVELAWDACAGLLAPGPEGDRGDGALVLIDDLDALTARFPDQHAPAFLEQLTSLLREGSSMGIRVAASAQRLTPSVQSLAGLFDARLLLRLPSRQELVMAGGDGAHHAPAAPPGRGRWNGLEVQVARASGDVLTRRSADLATRLPITLAGEGPLAIVTTRPTAFIDAVARLGASERVCTPSEALGRLAAAAGSPIVVGDAQSWQAAWSALGVLRQRGAVLFDRCSPSEFRIVSGVATLPPPLSRVPGGGWLLRADGSVLRVQIPDPLFVDKFND